MDRKCLLGVFAHPDDEAFSLAGSYRKYGDQGIRTALVCATRGEAGEISDPRLASVETIGQVREQELRDACALIGVDDLSFLDYHDGRLADADPVEATGRIVFHLRRLRPQVVVTFDDKGVYGHPDHVAIHHLTRAACEQAGDAVCYPEHRALGLSPYAPQKLYTVAAPVSLMRDMAEEARALGMEYRPGGDAATLATADMGTPDEDVTTQIALSDAEFEVKMKALHAHRTQMNPESFVMRISLDVMRRWRGSEHFVRILPPPRTGADRETDLFAGVTV